jgi:predicted metal-binding protein
MVARAGIEALAIRRGLLDFKCPGTRVDCMDKAASRPSPEAFAVDVYATARHAGFDINVIADNPSEINRMAILLVE